MKAFSTAGLTGQRELRRLVGGALEMIIAESAIAALEQAIAHAGPVHVDDQTFAVFFIDLGPDRHLHDGVIAIGTGHHLALAAFATLRLHMLLEAVVDKCVEIFYRLGDHVAAAAAVAAVRPAIFDELLAPKGDAAVAAGSTAA